MLRLALIFTAALTAAEHRGTVLFGGLPVPGVSVLAHGQHTITDPNGAFLLQNLPAGPITIHIEMQLFTPKIAQIPNPAEPSRFELELAPLTPAKVSVATAKSAFQRPETKTTAPPTPAVPPTPAASPDPEANQRAADGLLINGSVNNGAASPFAQLPAFGNNRLGARSMYNASLGLILNHSLLDARSYSLTGQDTPKPDYSRAQGLFAFGGPIKIPKWLPKNGPMLTVNYQWTRNTNALTQSGLVPNSAQRAGLLPTPARDPLTNQPFPNNQIPPTRISPQAKTLLTHFPIPNITGSSRYNFQTPIVSGLHQDDLQTRVNKQRRKNFFSGNFNWQSTRTSNPDLYGFLDTARSMGLNTGFNYRRALQPRFFLNLGVNYSRMNDRLTPYFSQRRNVSAEAGITGNNQDPVNWGPPSLTFSTGITPLSSPQASFTRNQTTAYNADAFYNRAGHNLTFGAVHRRQQFNLLGQQDARGGFVFNGAATGNDVAGFLLGIPDTSTIAFGNADKYFRATINEAFANDDWRVNPGLTLNYGLRWEYWSPIEEKYGRLVNLNQSPLTPDRNNFAPRFGFSWRPRPASSLLVRGGYGIYYDTSVYLPIATKMAQQAPLSKNVRVSNTAATPLSLANGFPPAASALTFAVDPNLRVGYSQSWQLSLQRDLPAALQLVLNYSGAKGTRAQQQFLPNTFPNYSLDPSGYTFLVSNGNSIRHAGQLQLRRRLRRGLTSQLTYTYSKSIDNAALGARGQLTAQNWLDLSAERGRSNFDQRHLLAASAQYTTSWKPRLLKEWTATTQLTSGTGLPLTPIYLAAVRGTGVTGALRPDYTGQSIYDAPPGLFLNPAAVAPPAADRWGNAGRNSITGPSQFALSASLGRTFRANDKFNLDARLDASNALNSVRFPTWNTVAGNAQFGLPITASPMRTIQLTLRSRF